MRPSDLTGWPANHSVPKLVNSTEGLLKKCLCDVPRFADLPPERQFLPTGQELRKTVVRSKAIDEDLVSIAERLYSARSGLIFSREPGWVLLSGLG